MKKSKQVTRRSGFKKLACKYKSPEQKEMFQYQLDVLEEVLTF